jgi:hypothetical protein
MAEKRLEEGVAEVCAVAGAAEMPAPRSARTSENENLWPEKITSAPVMRWMR